MPNAAKAARYVNDLNETRINDLWDAVPTLVRKVRKHAPHRTCLALTAESEYAIAKSGRRHPTADGPTHAAAVANSAAASGSTSGLEARIPRLLSAIDEDGSFPEDRFQAKTCVGWLHWILGDYELAASRLPMTFDYADAQHQDQVKIAQWTQVCVLKAVYLRANCLARSGLRQAALEVYDGSLPSLTNVWTTQSAGKQLHYWAELLLTEYCMATSQAISANEKSLTDPNCLACFRAWAKYFAGAKGGSLEGVYGFHGSVPRRRVWADYYAAVSRLVQEDLPFPTGYAPIDHEASARSRLQAELKKVEMIYQGLLFSQTKFPRAEEERSEVEAFAELLMRNWVLLNARGWREADLRPGGKESLSRGVLESLYGAAVKTFHSTAILRSLFTVHLAVAEFDVAFQSFDSYLDLIGKRKARVEKTGQAEASLDDDATILQTVSACIVALCRYGGRQEAEKAKGLAAELEGMLSKLGQYATGQEDALLNEQTFAANIPGSIYALAWQSIGFAHAQLARLTYDPASRPQMQDKAIQCLGRSLAPEFGRAADIRGVFALGLLYAEQRKVSAAIELIKNALLARSAPDDKQKLHRGRYWRERGLIPVWHLLALMLSARQEYLMASRACEGAIEQFRDPYILFGCKNLYHGQCRSEHDAGDAADGVVDDMDDDEKEEVLQIKMTQLSILEVTEGPAVAVNATPELLTLFARLFGDVAEQAERPQMMQEPPRTAGTLRNMQTSIFGTRSSRAGEKTTASQGQTMPTRHATIVATPSIHVTSERGDGGSSHQGRNDAISTTGSRRKRNSLHTSDTNGNGNRASSPGHSRPRSFRNMDGQDEAARFEAAPPPRPSSCHTQHHTPSYACSAPQLPDLQGISVTQIDTFATLLPCVTFSNSHHKAARSTILAKIWLLIASWYRRADQMDNAHEACAEAQKLVSLLEADMSKDRAGAVVKRQASWACGTSIEQLLASVWTEKALLAAAKREPFHARANFETALMHDPDHPAAIVGLSNILMDLYDEKLLPPPVVPGLSALADLAMPADTTALSAAAVPPPLGLGRQINKGRAVRPCSSGSVVAGPFAAASTTSNSDKTLCGSNSRLLPYKATSLPLMDRLAARDRAYGLLSGLTKLGSGWNNSEVWFALARAYEASGQAERAKEVLWWCLELEDGSGVRSLAIAGGGRFVL